MIFRLVFFRSNELNEPIGHIVTMSRMLFRSRCLTAYRHVGCPGVCCQGHKAMIVIIVIMVSEGSRLVLE